MTRSDLDAYFARIGYGGTRDPTLATLHAITRSHAQSIPFENLDVLLKRPIDISLKAIVRKLVHERRGGYCFEQNGLLQDVLATLGFTVTALAARVRLQRPRDYIPPRTHTFIRVEVAGESWLTDVGVGGVSLTSAIRLQTDDEQTTPHESRRLVREGNRVFHQARLGDARQPDARQQDPWVDVCEFTLDEMPPIDREIANWYTSGHPRSHFRDRLIVARAAPNGVRLTVVNHDFKIRGPDGRATTQVIASADDLLRILKEHFNLHFPAGTRFGPPGSPWPSL